MLRLVAVTTLVGAAALAGAGPAAAEVGCTRAAAVEVLRAQFPDYSGFEDNQGGLQSTRCADVTRDGVRDVLFTVSGGGTGGAFDWGLIDGRSGRIVTRGGGGSKLSIAIRAGRAEVGNPLYRSGDPGCCPTGGARIRTYRWNGSRLALSTTRRVKALPARFG